jgi:hypothetical protein
LPGGDANDDNAVGLPDLSILASSYGTCAVDARPDFNGDNCAGLPDLSILAANYARTGAALAGTVLRILPRLPILDGVAHTRQSAAEESVDMSVSSASVHVGDVFTVTVTIAAGGKEVGTAEADLEFDPGFLTILGVHGAGPLSFTPPGNYFDPATGRLRYAAARLGAPFPTGTFALCEVRLRAIRATESTVADLQPPSAVLRNGVSLLESLIDGAVHIEGGTPGAPPRRWLPAVFVGKN